MKKNNCNICNKQTNISSKLFNYYSKDKVNWIHDSILFIIKEKKVKVSLIFCAKCLHANLLPKFDTSLLYNSQKTSLIRKKIFEKYNKNLFYGTSSSNKQISNKKIRNEFKRIALVTQEIINSINFDTNVVKETLNINLLDWGGGLGHIFNITKNIIESTNNIKINCNYYDPLVNNSKNNLLNKKYDYILISHVLEHIHNFDIFFNQIEKYINNKTKLIIEVPDERLEIIKSLIFNKKLSLKFHVNCFTKSSIKSLFYHHGYYSKFSYKNSFYRGNKMLIIFGTAYKNNKYKLKTDYFNEIIDLFIFFFRKLLNKI